MELQISIENRHVNSVECVMCQYSDCVCETECLLFSQSSFTHKSIPKLDYNVLWYDKVLCIYTKMGNNPKIWCNCYCIKVLTVPTLQRELSALTQCFASPPVPLWGLILIPACCYLTDVCAQGRNPNANSLKVFGIVLVYVHTASKGIGGTCSVFEWLKTFLTTPSSCQLWFIRYKCFISAL